MITNSSFKEYYSSFYGNQYFRELIYVDTDSGKVIDSLKFHKSSKVPNPDKKFYSLIHRNRNKGTGTLISSLTFYSNVEDFHSKDKRLRYTDRLFFDFDMDSSEEVKKIKENMGKAKIELHGKERIAAINSYQKQFRNLILNDNLLLRPFNELKSLMDYFMENLRIKPYPVFSGSKGFHLIVFLNPMKLINIDKISYNLAVHLKKKLNLELIDLSVNKDPISRKQRIPYSRHERTGLYTVPIDNAISYDELLQQIQKNKIRPLLFDKESYVPDEIFHHNLINLNDKITEEMMKEQMKQQELQKQKRELLAAKRINDNHDSVDIDFSNIDMRTLISKVIGNPEKEYSGYSMFKCPFHNDNNPSLKVTAKYCSCYSCGFYYNYYDFIKEYYNLKTQEEIIKKLYEIY